jgi:hypothetical protein
MDDKALGLYDKFIVERKDLSSVLGGKHEKCQYFVLDANCDPHAIPALLAYAESCKTDYPQLAVDVRNLAQTHCEHTWTETLFGPDAIGEHCEVCGADKGDPEPYDER